MKRHTALIPLSHDHRRILFFAQAIKRGISPFRDAPATTNDKLVYAQQFVNDLLQMHFECEETVLFRTIQSIDPRIDALIVDLIAEHAAIRQQCHALAALTNEHTIESALHALGHAVEAHVRTEERQLFERVQAVVPEGVLQTLGIRLHSPTAWR